MSEGLTVKKKKQKKKKKKNNNNNKKKNKKIKQKKKKKKKKKKQKKKKKKNKKKQQQQKKQQKNKKKNKQKTGSQLPIVTLTVARITSAKLCKGGLLYDMVAHIPTLASVKSRKHTYINLTPLNPTFR